VSEEKKMIFRPLSPERWADFEKLFGERGACGGCWCMSWRIPPKEFQKNKGQGNKTAMRKLVRAGEQIGIIGYLNKEPVAWCAVAPREKYSRLENSRVLRRIDDQPVWSITCFFIAKPCRRMGLSVEMLKGVIAFCKKKKIEILEAYPIRPYSKNMPAAFAWTGFVSAFEKAGFVEAKRWSKSRPIMRYYL
jgi:GNAT superfamily N-acetyltransferase